MTTVPPEVDATDLPDDDEDLSGLDVFAPVLKNPSGPYDFADADWPEPVKPEPRPPHVNPFQAKVDAMIDLGHLPSRAVVFLAPDADVKLIKGQIKRAAGERATAQVKTEPATDGMTTVRFRLAPKIRRSHAVDDAATSGGQVD